MTTFVYCSTFYLFYAFYPSLILVECWPGANHKVFRIPFVVLYFSKTSLLSNWISNIGTSIRIALRIPNDMFRIRVPLFRSLEIRILFFWSPRTGSFWGPNAGKYLFFGSHSECITHLGPTFQVFFRIEIRQKNSDPSRLGSVTMHINGYEVKL